MSGKLAIRNANHSDLDQLIEIENDCFESDRISRRSFRHILSRGHASLLVAERDNLIIGYVLALYHRGTSLARLYSIAVSKKNRESGVARQLVKAVETDAINHSCISMRLEIREDNHPSLRLFEILGYVQFGRYLQYYEDNTNAVRLEKKLINVAPSMSRVDYYQQTTDFTCGPASLMMAMHALNPNVIFSRSLELQLWRESTTIYMTSGHGGCSPFGLALAAHRRNFEVDVYVKKGETLFIDSVRSPDKKAVIKLVETDFRKELNEHRIPLHLRQLTTAEIISALDNDKIPVILISSYRIYREKFPHWVVVTGHDAGFIYFHDPYIDEEKGKSVTDCLNMPIPMREFERMTKYGKSGQHAAIVLYKKGRRTKSL